MNQQERILTIQQGAAALQAAFGDDDPPPAGWTEDAEFLRSVRDLAGLMVRLQMVIDLQYDDADLADMAVLGFGLEAEDDVLRACEDLLRAGGPYRKSVTLEQSRQLQAIQSLRALLQRYGAGEFVPDVLPGE